MLRLLFHLLLLSLLAPSGCERRPDEPPVRTAQPVTYEVNGVIREIRTESRRAVIAHEAIPGYMGAMTMEFAVADPRELATLRPGDPISFRLVVTPERGWINHIRLRPEILVPPAPPAPSSSPPPAALEVGDRVPDLPLVDHAGRAFRLRELRGRPLAFTFIFTRCPFPDYCPRLNAQFAAAQHTLAPGEAELLSISIDPAYDTPARLAEYAIQFQPDPSTWRFATGEPTEIRRLGAAFGLAPMENGMLNHHLRTVVVDATGHIEKIFAGNEWTAGELIGALSSAAGGK